MRSSASVVHEVTSRLLADLDALTDEVLACIDAVDTGYDDGCGHVDLIEAGRRSVHGNLRAALQSLGDDPQGAPAEALAEATLCAAAGVPLAALLQTYRLGQAHTLEVLLDRLEDLGLPAATRRAAAARITRATFAYVDALAPAITEAYEAERARLARSSDRHRREAALAVLDGAPADAVALGWDLRGWHVAVVASGPHAAAALDELLGPAALVIAAGAQLAWGWARSAAPSAALEGHRIGIGEPGRDAEGFRRTHRQATLALRVVERTGVPAARYADVALETLALADEDGARAFVAEQLGRLAEDVPREARLRCTLDAYLRARCNARAAAAALGVSDGTVAYRMRAVEEVLGRPAPPHATELALALRWHTLLRA